MPSRIIITVYSSSTSGPSIISGAMMVVVAAAVIDVVAVWFVVARVKPDVICVLLLNFLSGRERTVTSTSQEAKGKHRLGQQRNG